MIKTDFFDFWVDFVSQNKNKKNKEEILLQLKKHMDFEQKRSLYIFATFVLRFSKSKNSSFTNTVLGLSTLKKHDNKPLIVFVLSENGNYSILANSTFLSKVSHSSQNLTTENIKGSFNGGDIKKEYKGIKNTEKNFKDLFAFHSQKTFHENLERIVKNTSKIKEVIEKKEFSLAEKKKIKEAPKRYELFLKKNFIKKIRFNIQEEIGMNIATIKRIFDIENNNLRGRYIEKITSFEKTGKEKEIILSFLNLKGTKIPEFDNENGLGDTKISDNKDNVLIDIKSKRLSHLSNPKAFNVDKFLKEMGKENVYLFYLFIVFDEEKDQVDFNLINALNPNFINSIRFAKHWAGRNTRGSSQFLEKQMLNFINSEERDVVDVKKAEKWLENMVENL